jgi:hypothetical protein
MAGTKYTTTDPEIIKRWAAARNGRPALIRDAGNGVNTPVLSIYLPDYTYRTSYDEISWNECFKRREEENLVFLYQEKTESGDRSLFGRFVSPQIAMETMAESTAEPPPASHAPSSTGTPLTQTDSLQTPLARGTETFRHPEQTTSPSRIVPIGLVICVILTILVILVSFWPERW